LTSAISDDPITTDPAPVDWDYPPAIVTITPKSHGDSLNGIVYISHGPGPHPTIIMLHGYPGDEQNLDLAQAIRRAGWNVVFFHYRGAWGSGGTFSVEHAMEDIGAIIDYVSLPQSQSGFRIDASRIALVGHSMGAYLALLAGARLPVIQHIIAISPVNLGHAFATMNPEDRAILAENLEAMGHGAIQSTGMEHFIKMGDAPARYDVMQNSEGLDGKSLFFIAAARDEDTPPAYHCEPIVNLLQERNKATVALTMLDTDHQYSTARIALARSVIKWLAST